jgi:YVTN family beta-propeller protein
VNTATNKVYIANYYGGKVTVIDGFTNHIVSAQAGLNPVNVAVNPATNKIYVANWDSAEVTIIDGATNAITKVTIAGKSEEHSIVVNTVTNKVYIASNAQSKRITVGLIIDFCPAERIIPLFARRAFSGLLPPRSCALTREPCPKETVYGHRIDSSCRRY